MVNQLNPIFKRWINYFRIANCKRMFWELMTWIKRRLRIKKMRKWKMWKGSYKQLRKMGYR
ncbi:group II intron maturase-specific domain-containing protein [Caloranaerobacter sp. DY30410]|uniref:group II intron maturase-specific domain-containing protein n=1 Tax=Caloranaerobacter sp. DY30410 TaxID=3238305 RepID=UPI003CFDC04A